MHTGGMSGLYSKRLGRGLVGMSLGVFALGCAAEDTTSTASSSSVAPSLTIELSTTSTTSTTSTLPSEPATTSTLPVTPSSEPVTSATLPVTAIGAGTWAPTDLPAWATNPCCATPWPVDEPSPLLPAPGQAFDDGVYRLQIADRGWMPFAADKLRLRVSRFDRCGDVDPDDIWCESGMPADPDEIGERNDQAIEFEVALDAKLTVGLTGAACAADGGPARLGWVGDGEALQALWIDIDRVFETWVREPMYDGANGWTLMSELEASGAPFITNLCIPEGEAGFVAHVSYVSPAGPTLLYQTVSDYSDQTQALQAWQLFAAATLEVRDGRMLLMLERDYQS